jgi:hypothetical protein|tara:strand:+ start:548 stop:919 length:372 start_codon:yes stop_codon:yes gene_type:complete
MAKEKVKTLMVYDTDENGEEFEIDINTGEAVIRKIDYKFDEDLYLNEMKEYVDATYDGHYSTNTFQSTEVIIDRGHGTGFCMGNVDKYSNRYGKKGTREDARKDLMKILHYALIQLYVHDNGL